MNEIIAYAKEHEIDFDKPVVGEILLNITIPFQNFQCHASLKNNLILEIPLSKNFQICHCIDNDEDEE